MGQFPITFTERTVSGRGPSVRGDVRVPLGGDVGRAVGQGALALGKWYSDTISQTQLSEFQRKANEEMGRLAISRQTNLDPETYQSDYKKSLEVINSFMPKHSGAARNAQLWLNAKEPGWSKNTFNAMEDRADDNWKAELFQKQALVGRTGQIGSFPVYLADGVKNGRIDKSAAVKELTKTNKMAITGQIGLLYGAGKYEEARTLTKESNLGILEKESLLNTIDTEENRSNTQIKLVIKQKDDAIGDGFLNLLVNKLEPGKPQLTFDMITSSELSFDAKTKWFTKLRTFDNYSEQELKEAFTDKGEVLADIYDKIDDGIITDDQIRDQVGEGLSAPTAQRIIKERRMPFEKDTEQLFKRIFGWSPELGFKDDFAGFLYEKALREWNAEVKEQKATGEEIIKIGRSVVRPYFLEHIKRSMPSEEDITRMMELALGEETEKLETPKPIEAETPREEPSEPLTYPDFESEVTRLKGIDMIKARQYYDTWIGKFKKEAEE